MTDTKALEARVAELERQNVVLKDIAFAYFNQMNTKQQSVAAAILMDVPHEAALAELKQSMAPQTQHRRMNNA